MPLKPTPEDREKIHNEVNQIMNQRFVLTTFALTVFGAISAWLLPKTQPSADGGVGRFVYAASIGLSFVVFWMYWLHHSLKKYPRVLTTYLQMSKGSGWESDWTDYRLVKHFSYTGYQHPQTVLFTFLGLLALAYPLGVKWWYSLCFKPWTGLIFGLIFGVANVSYIAVTGFRKPNAYEGLIRSRWEELDRRQEAVTLPKFEGGSRMTENVDAQESKTAAQPSLPNLPPEFLIRMHEFAEGELCRYRDVQWQVPSIVIVFLFALCGAIGTDYVGDLIRSRPFRLEGGFSILVGFLWIFIITFVHHTDRNRQKMYNLLLYLENQMKVTPHIKRIVTPTGELTANQWKQITQKKIVLVYPIDLITTLASALSLGLIWFKK